MDLFPSKNSWVIFCTMGQTGTTPCTLRLSMLPVQVAACTAAPKASASSGLMDLFPLEKNLDHCLRDGTSSETTNERRRHHAHGACRCRRRNCISWSCGSNQIPRHQTENRSPPAWKDKSTFGSFTLCCWTALGTIILSENPSLEKNPDQKKNGLMSLSGSFPLKNSWIIFCATGVRVKPLTWSGRPHAH